MMQLFSYLIIILSLLSLGYRRIIQERTDSAMRMQEEPSAILQGLLVEKERIVETRKVVNYKKGM